MFGGMGVFEQKPGPRAHRYVLVLLQGHIMAWSSKLTGLKNNKQFRTLLAEALGMTIFVYVGIAATVQVFCGFYTYHYLHLPFEFGSMPASAVANGLGLAAAFLLCSRVSGYHLNPAVTVSYAIFGRIEWNMVPVYVGAQLIGAFIASVVAFSVHVDTVDRFDKREPFLTDSAFVSFPVSRNSSTFSLALDQTWGTSLYTIIVYGLSDSRGRVANSLFAPLLAGASYSLVMLSNNQLAGALINPARDFSARLFVLIAQYGTEVWSSRGYFFWVPLLMPFMGAAIGGLIYQGTIGFYWPPLPPPRPTARQRYVKYLTGEVRAMKEYLRAIKMKELEELEMEVEKVQRVNVDLPRHPPQSSSLIQQQQPIMPPSLPTMGPPYQVQAAPHDSHQGRNVQEEEAAESGSGIEIDTNFP